MASDFAEAALRPERAARTRQRRLVAFAAALTAVTLALLIAFPPGWLAVAVCLLIAFTMVAWYRPVWAVAILLGSVLLVEQYDFARFRPLTRLVPLYDSISYTTGVHGIPVAPLEIMMIIVLGVVVTRVAAGTRHTRVNPLAGLMILLVAAFAAWLAFGVASGGTLSAALWEVRALGYFALLGYIVPQVIDSEKDVRTLIWVAIVGVGIKAAQGAWNYLVVLQGDASQVRSVTPHEDALFIAWMGILLIGLIVYRAAEPRQRNTLLVLSPLMLYTFALTNRRAAYVALGAGFLVLCALVATDRAKRSLVVRACLAVVIATTALVVVGWNASGPLAKPAEVVRSIVAPTDKEDADSNAYRKVEEANLMHAVQSSPAFGLGFGRPFQAPGQGGITDIGLYFENVIAHNQIIWIWAKTGTVGFALFWVVMGGVIVFAGITFRQSSDPYTKVLCALVASAVVMQIFVSYVDLQLTYARNMVILGVLVGILATLPRFERCEVQDATE